MCFTPLPIIVKIWKQPNKCSQTGWWLNTLEYYVTHKKNEENLYLLT